MIQELLCSGSDDKAKILETPSLLKNALSWTKTRTRFPDFVTLACILLMKEIETPFSYEEIFDDTYR